MLKQKAKDLLEKVAITILEQPARLSMNNWGSIYSPDYVGNRDISSSEVPVCRTQGCIAGWTIFLGRPTLRTKLLKETTQENYSIFHLDCHVPDGAEEYAIKLLGITQEQADRLFYLPGFGFGEGWPKEFSGGFHKAKTDKQKAKITAARIRFFIQTDGTDRIKKELQAA